jgi:effector-binding domain-containing protein
MGRVDAERKEREPRMEYQIEVKELPARPVATIRVRTTMDRIGAEFAAGLPEVLAHLQKHGQGPDGPSLGIYHVYEGSEVDMEYGFPVAHPVPSEGRVEVHELPHGFAATTMHVGPYSSIGRAHRAVSDWIEEQGRQGTGPPWEVYWSDPQETPAAELRTEVGYPIEPPR